MITILTLLFIYVAWVTLSLFYSIFGEIFTERTTTIILSIAGVIESIIAATFWFSAKNRQIGAWRAIWMAGAILCFSYGWFTVPKIYEDQLMKKAVATSIQMEGVSEAYPFPKTDEEKRWVLENKQKAVQANLRWKYYKEININKNNWRSILNFIIGFLCLLCSFLPESVICRINRKAIG